MRRARSARDVAGDGGSPPGSATLGGQSTGAARRRSRRRAVAACVVVSAVILDLGANALIGAPIARVRAGRHTVTYRAMPLRAGWDEIYLHYLRITGSSGTYYVPLDITTESACPLDSLHFGYSPSGDTIWVSGDGDRALAAVDLATGRRWDCTGNDRPPVRGLLAMRHEAIGGGAWGVTSPSAAPRPAPGPDYVRLAARAMWGTWLH